VIERSRTNGWSISNTLLKRRLVVWASKPPITRFLGFGPQHLVRVLVGTRGDTWHHHKSCVDMKRSRGYPMVVRYIDLELNHNVPRVK
jgi:hypothetical protein